MPKCRTKRHSVTQPLDKPYRFIPLTQGKNAIVDVDDFDWLLQFTWHALGIKCNGAFYAQSSKGSLMHREIMKCKLGEQVDHIDHDGLNNRKSNLRIATHAQNMRNKRKLNVATSSRFKGVYFDNSGWKGSKPWRAQIKIGGVKVTLGRFTSEEEAAASYNVAAKELHGDFAHTN